VLRLKLTELGVGLEFGFDVTAELRPEDDGELKVGESTGLLALMPEEEPAGIDTGLEG